MSDELERRLTRVEDAVVEIRESTKQIATAVQQLALLEAHHAETRSGLTRAFAAIKEQNDRLMAIEVHMPGLKELRKWVISGVLAVCGTVGLAIVALVVRLT